MFVIDQSVMQYNVGKLVGEITRGFLILATATFIRTHRVSK